MENQFTNCEAYDNLFPKYKNWEEVPMSTLNFNSKTSQVCFVSLPKDKALEIITSKAIPVNTSTKNFHTNKCINNFLVYRYSFPHIFKKKILHA